NTSSKRDWSSDVCSSDLNHHNCIWCLLCFLLSRGCCRLFYFWTFCRNSGLAIFSLCYCDGYLGRYYFIIREKSGKINKPHEKEGDTLCFHAVFPIYL